MKVSVLCVVFGNLQEAIGNLEKLSSLDIIDEILILENSNVGDVNENFQLSLHNFPDLVVDKFSLYTKKRNLGFGPGVQYLIEQAKNEILLVINPDCEPDVEVVPQVSDHISSCTCTVAFGAIQEIDSRRLSNQPRFFPFLSLFTARELPSLLNYFSMPYFLGALFFVKRSEILEAGGYSKYFLYFDELDTTKKLHRSGKVVHFLDVQIGKHVGGTVTKISVDGFNPRMYYSAYFAVKFYSDYYRSLLVVIILNRILKCFRLLIRGNFEHSKWVFLGSIDGLLGKKPRGVS
jgi:GT2 family glycosyltransferase